MKDTYDIIIKDRKINNNIILGDLSNLYKSFLYHNQFRTKFYMIGYNRQALIITDGGNGTGKM